jgi:hypothetical protein
MIELFEKFKAARVKGACIIPEVFNNVLEIWVLSPTVLLLLNFGPHVLETVYTSFEQSVGV